MENQPKKRGRKKKIIAPEVKESSAGNIVAQPEAAIVEDHPPQAVTTLDKSESHGKDREERKEKRIEMAKKIENDANEIDKIMNTKSFRDKVLKRFLANRPAGNKIQIKKAIERNLKIFQDLKNDVCNENDIVSRTNLISFEMVKKNCKLLEFLLENGPKTRIEEDIFEKCIECISLYYKERTGFMFKNLMDPLHCLKTTYFPKKDSIAYDFLKATSNIPDEQSLLDIFTNKISNL